MEQRVTSWHLLQNMNLMVMQSQSKHQINTKILGYYGQQSRRQLFLVFGTETRGLAITSELLQVSCTLDDGSATFFTYLLPKKQTIADSAMKVHRISLQ